MSLAPAPPRNAPPPDWQRRVARAFSRAAEGYVQRAGAQQAMGEALWNRLPGQAARILDLGCGPGHWSTRLARRYGAGSRVIGLDLAPGMIEVARRQHGDGVRWLCADAAALPLHAQSQDLIFSNLAIQWCPDLETVLKELQRVLRPGGRALITSLAPGTLAEVAQAWSRPGQPAALLDFRTRERHLAAARLAGFRRVACRERLARFHYPDLAAVMTSIKGIGAQASRAGTRLTRGDLARAVRRFEGLREPEGLPISYRLLTLELEA